MHAGRVTYWSTVSADESLLTSVTPGDLDRFRHTYRLQLEHYLIVARRTIGLCRVSVGYSPLPPVPLHFDGDY